MRSVAGFPAVSPRFILIYDDHQGPMGMISWLQSINLISTADIWLRNRAEMVIMVEIKGKLEATLMS